MKILWLSVNNGLYKATSKIGKGYNGGGWVSSLQKLIISNHNNKLALAYITNEQLNKEQQENTIYYPIYESHKAYIQKFKEYYGGYKKKNSKKYLIQIKQIIQDFQPDIIHLFGLENPLAIIIRNTSVPIVIHLQGLLAPYDNAFFPVNFNKSSFLIPFSIREWVFRNGYIFAKNNIHVRGEKELSLLKKVEYVMGRTDWDYQMSSLLAPQTKYFHVDEVLRDSFYENAGKWKYPESNTFYITSTISNTVYKGLDTVLKTAKLLKEQTVIPFKWNVIGLSQKDPIVRFFESKLKINSSEVRVEYLGVLNENDLCDRLLDSHIYVHPSYIDNSPNSLCEAQLLGMPVIGTYVGGIPSLIKHKENGILVPSNAPYELAYNLKKCYKDKDFTINIGRNSYNTAKYRHDKKIILDSLLKTYSEVIEASKTNVHDNF